MAEHKTLAEVVDAIDPASQIELYEVGGMLRGANLGTPVSSDDCAEAFAFSVMGHDPEANPSPWGSYFGPFISLSQPDGTVLESPSLADARPPFIGYWIARAETMRHPLLRAHYADLAWDMWRTIGGARAPISMVGLAIDGYLEAVVGGLLKHPTSEQALLGRCLRLALATRRRSDISRVASEILAYQRRVEDDALPGTWTTAFDLLVDRPRPVLEPAQVEELLAGLERHVARLAGVDHPTPHPVQDIIVRLARYYRSHGRADDAHRLIRRLGEIAARIDPTVSGLVRMAWISEIVDVYRQFGLGREAAEFSGPLRESGGQAVTELHPFTVEVTLPVDKLEALKNEYLSLSTPDALARLAWRFTFGRDHALAQLEASRKNAPLASMFGTIRLDSRGRIMARMAGGGDDAEARLVAAATTTLDASAILLRHILDALHTAGKLTVDGIVDYCLASPAIRIGKSELLRRGVAAFLAHDSAVSMHLLIPIFEDGIRECLVLLNELELEFDNSSRGYREPTLRPMLASPALSSVVGAAAVWQWQVLFTDARGINLRNRLSHGLLEDSDFTQAYADRVFQSLLQIGSVRLVEPAGGGTGAKVQ